MTALALTTSSLTPQGSSLDWSRWLSADEAARLLGVHVTTLRRRCEQMRKRRVAMFCVGPEGGKAKWWISRGYDLRLAPGAAGAAHRTPDLSAYGERQVNLAMQRAACVKRLWRTRAGETRSQKAWLPALIAELRGEHPDLRISRSTLFTWHAVYRDPADLVMLIDTRGGNTRGKPDPLCWDLFRALYLTEHKRRRKWCWKQVRVKAKADGLTWCSYRQLLRLVRSRLSPAERCKHRAPEKYRSKYSDYIDMDPDTWRAAETWIGDHGVLDLWCLHQGKLIRPWLTAWMDWRTRKIVGWVLCVIPSSRTILAAFARAMRDVSNQGGPDTVYIDNGKDYAAETFAGKTKQQFRKARSLFHGGDYDQPAFRGLYGMLDIEVIFATPYNARAKGRLEQWFNYSLHEDFDKSWPSYAGNRPENRPASLAAVLKAGASGGVPTFNEVSDRIAAHVKGYNQSCDHGKDDLDGMSPNEAMSLGRLRVFADTGVLDRFMLTYSKPARVRRHRIRVAVLGKGLIYKSDDPVFADLNGRADEFRVGYDQDDLREATLFDESMRPVCRLYEATLGRATQHGDAVSREHLSDAIARQRRLNRARKVQAQAGLDQVLSTQELALIEAGRGVTPNLQSSTPNLHPTKLVQTPVDGYANELQRQEFKQAAGAECSPGSLRGRADDDDGPFTIPDTLSFMDGIIPSPSDEDDDTAEDPWDVCGGGDTIDQDTPSDPLAVVEFDEAGPGEDEPDDPLTYFDPQDGRAV